ncbi:hypothetical protein G6O69_33300 [Pseudenhygromyxa sp. WMMC2535]|uniref:hypothetical protein n=1 Tax=Pseudenhygromyxa sp. WMMC2535 TaxID=2712867 RepID=UPI0015518875|nr:hypothetical protein [Pseudenhygromyxa sp. WMMC2535]NVB42746.1 hypothetical protein [Pseudenhygromyxa sp. WMMC2535]
MRAERTRDGDSTLALDDRHFPVLISKWFGRPTVLLAKSYFDWLGLMIERAEFYETKAIHILDATEAKLPNAETRRHLAQEAARMHEQFTPRGTMLQAVVTPPSELVRKLLTVVRWSLTGDAQLPLTTVASLPEAIDDAIRRLAAAGIEAPSDLDSRYYRLDERVVNLLPETSGASFRIVPDSDR